MHILMGKLVEQKSWWMYEKIHTLIKNNPADEHVIIVPEQYTVQAEKDYIHASGCEGFINPEIISFNRLGHRIFQETGGRTRTVIDELGKHMLVKKILIDLEADLRLFSGLVREPGMIERIVDSITELKQYEISPDELNQHVVNLEDDLLLKNKLSDLVKIYRSFESSLENNYVDQEDQYLALMRQMKDAEYIHQKIFWIDGFYSFTPQMLSVIKEMSLHAKEIYLTAYGSGKWLETNEDILSYEINQLISDLDKNGHKCRVTDVDAHLKHQGDPAIHHLAEKFATLPIAPWLGNADAIQLFSANTDDSEIEQVASKILELVQEKNYRYSEISVLCANLEERQDSIKRVFSLQKIPFFLDVRRKQIEHPLIQLIPLAIDVIIKKYSYQSIMRYLKAGFSGLSQEEVEIFESEIIGRGIRGQAWKKEFSFNVDTDKLTMINHLREKVVGPLSLLEEGLRTASNARLMTTSVYEWLTKIDVPGLLEAEIDLFLSCNELETASMLSQLWDKIYALMDQLVDLLGGISLSLVEYQNLWKTGLNSIEIGLIPPTNDQVMIGTPERSRQSGIKALFLIGINDGVLPAVPGDTGVLLLHEKELLHKSGCTVGTFGELRIAHENLMIQLALGRPTETLWLSYSQSTVEGDMRRPSTMIERVKLIVPQLKTFSDLKQNWLQELALLRNPNYSYLSLASKLREMKDGKEVSPHWRTLYTWFVNQQEWVQGIEELKRALNYHNQPLKLDSNRSMGLFRKPYTSSVSRLEHFNRCPFAHFVRYGLTPVKRKVYEIAPPDIGTALHEMMDLFGKKIVEENLDIFKSDAGEIQTISEEIATNVLDGFNEKIFHSSARFNHHGIRIKRIGCRAIHTTVYQLRKSGFMPVQNEISFGNSSLEKGSKPFVLFNDNAEPIHLEGRIDRIDRWEDDQHVYFRVIDYKSGRKEFSVSEIISGIQLQLVVYLMAALEISPLKNQTKSLKPGGMYYFYLDDPLIELQSNDEKEATKKTIAALKLNGVTLNNDKVIHEMDQEIGSDSDVIPVGFTKTGSFKKSSKVLTEPDFLTLQKFTEMKIIETANSISNGIIKIHPVQMQQWKSCDHCDYLTICQFDQQFTGNDYKKLHPQNDEDSLREMTKMVKKEEEDHAPMD